MKNPHYVVIMMGITASLLSAESLLEQGARLAKEKLQSSPTIQALQEKATKEILAKFKKQSFPYQNEVARVRVGNTLGDYEQAFRAAREPIIRIGLGKLLGREITERRLPTIGLCMSGGGYRAMLLSMAFMGGLQQMGMLDATMYAVGLSGSTWSLLYWLASGKTSRGSLNTLIETAGRGQILPPSEWQDVITVLMTKKAHDQNLTIVDLWGAYLVEQIFSDVSNQQNYVFSQLKERVSSGQVPFSIGTAVSDNIVSQSTQYQWFECSPFEVGSTFLNAWIPVWAAGRTFHNGVSINSVPEQTLGFWLGVFGSAFSVSIGDIINRAPEFVPNELFNKFIKPIAQPIKDTAGSQRVVEGGRIPNFAIGLPTTPESARNVKMLELVDGGHLANYSMPPLLRPERAVDIIFIFESGWGPVGPSLRYARDYAANNNLRFPEINVDGLNEGNIKVFGEPSDPRSLVVILIAARNNKTLPEPYGSFDMEKAYEQGFAGTTNFKYSLENAKLMTGYFEQNVIAQKAVIQDIVIQRLKALNQ